MTDYNDKTKDELLELAKERDLAGRSGLNKDELAKALEEDDNSPEGEEGDGLSESSQEAYDELDDESKDLADVEADEKGPLKLESPYERIVTGAVNEEQAKEQEAVRAKLPDEYVGDYTEAVSDADAEKIRKAFAGEGQDSSDYEPPLAEQFAARRERYAKLLRVPGTKVAKRNIEETQGGQGGRKLFAQRAVLDTTGLGGPGSNDLERAYDAEDVEAGTYKSVFDADTPRGKEVLEAEKAREEASSYSQES